MTKEEAASIISGYEAYGCGYCLQGGDEVEEALSLAIDALKQEPVRHGHWIGLTDSNFTCSECKETIYTWIGRRNNYCPNCGAKMDEEKEE